MAGVSLQQCRTAGGYPAAMGTRMRFPGYPSNREADEGAKMPLRLSRGKVRRQDEAKPGDLFTPKSAPGDGRRCSADGSAPV